jgi:hypothetical protein
MQSRKEPTLDLARFLSVQNVEVSELDGVEIFKRTLNNGTCTFTQTSSAIPSFIKSLVSSVGIDQFVAHVINPSQSETFSPTSSLNTAGRLIAVVPVPSKNDKETWAKIDEQGAAKIEDLLVEIAKVPTFKRSTSKEVMKITLSDLPGVPKGIQETKLLFSGKVYKLDTILAAGATLQILADSHAKLSAQRAGQRPINAEMSPSRRIVIIIDLIDTSSMQDRIGKMSDTLTKKGISAEQLMAAASKE